MRSVFDYLKRVSAYGITLALCAVACVEAPAGGGRTSPFVVIDSAGIEIVDSRRQYWTEKTRWEITPAPSLVIRTQEAGEAPFVLFGIGDIVRLSDGRIVVQNSRERQLLVFDVNGALSDVWGTAGDGPGEFVNPILATFRCADDTIVALQTYRSMAKIFAASGHVRDVRLGIPVQPNLRSAIGVSSDCTSVVLHDQVDAVFMAERAPNGAPEIVSHEGVHGVGVKPAIVLRHGIGSGATDTLGLFRDVEMDAGTRGGFMTFQNVAVYATDGERVFYGWGERPQVEVYDLEGLLQRIIRWAAESVPVSQEDWDAYDAERARIIAERPSYAVTYPMVRDHVERTHMPYYSAERHGLPYAERMLIDDAGNLWIAVYARPTLEAGYDVPGTWWWVFDAKGRWLGEVEAPAGFLIRSIAAGTAYGIWRDEFDVEEVRGYRIIKPR